MHRFRAGISRALLVLTIGAFALTGSGFGCKNQSAAVQEASKPVTVTWWRVFDGQETMQPMLEAYKTLHPNVTVVYRKLRYEEYERELINALAEDRGPDIVSLHNTEVRRFQSKLLPMPRQITLPYQVEQGTLKKEVVTVLKTTTLPSVRDVKNNFADVVAKDVAFPEDPNNPTSAQAVYGLPLGIDTLALFVNRDLLNLSGIPQAPRTWNEFSDAAKKMTHLGDGNTILQSGAAIGTAHNVERSSDILALIMMQDGAEMTDSSGSRAIFDQIPATLATRTVAPGEEALTFYTDFASPSKLTYAWNNSLPNSLDAFTTGKTAMFLGYSYHLPLIKARAPRMNLEMAPAPQIENNPPVNFANYFVESVSRKSKNPDFAWDLINFATSAKQVTPFLDAVHRPPALRSLIAPRTEDPDTGIFTAQILTAKSWYQGRDPQAAEAALMSMIDETLAGETELRDILRVGAAKVTQTLR